MRFFRESCRFLCLPLAALMILVSAPLTTVHAALVTTDEVVADPAATAAADREKIANFLRQEGVRDQLARPAQHQIVDEPPRPFPILEEENDKDILGRKKG